MFLLFALLSSVLLLTSVNVVWKRDERKVPNERVLGSTR